MKILNRALLSLSMLIGTTAFAICPSGSDTRFSAFPQSLDLKFNYSNTSQPTIDFHLAGKGYIAAGWTGKFWLEYQAYVRNSPVELYGHRDQRSADFEITNNPLGTMITDNTLFSDYLTVRPGDLQTAKFEVVVMMYTMINGGKAMVQINAYTIDPPSAYNIKKHEVGSYNEVNGDEFFGCNHSVTNLLQFDFPPSNNTASAFGYGYVKIDNQWFPNSASAAVIETTTGSNPEVYLRSLSASAMFPGFDANRGLKIKAEIKESFNTVKEGSFESHQSKDWLFDML